MQGISRLAKKLIGFQDGLRSKTLVKSLTSCKACHCFHELITMGYARTNVIGPRTSFVIAYIEIYVFKRNLFQAQSLKQSYHHHNNLYSKM
jgi:hypothetical protein